ncbi:hypothetical protein [Streptomyces sp. enrichment culture]|uniref:hypothetical protein n=1 Tax=Streptomyces sp. enrichment culture TaxID=1795815 RepID=UPI003F5657F1
MAAVSCQDAATLVLFVCCTHIFTKGVKWSWKGHGKGFVLFGELATGGILWPFLPVVLGSG